MKHILFLLMVLFVLPLLAQTTQDTIDFPFWYDMMQSKNPNTKAVKRAYDLYFSNKQKTTGTGYKIFERWYYNQSFLADKKGNLPDPNKSTREFFKFKAKEGTRSASGNWQSMGPYMRAKDGYWIGGVNSVSANSGRLNTIAFHPTDANKLYVGAPQGGLWTSINGGQTWQSNTDNLPSLGVSAIGVFPDSNKLIIGTGDRDANDAKGMGYFISRNNGATWTQSININNLTINEILVNPLNNKSIIFATNQGIYFSFDQGNTIVASDLPGGNNDKIVDLSYAANDTTVIYATSGNNGAFYRSATGVVGWAQIMLPPSPTPRRSFLAVSNQNPDLVYVLVAQSKMLSQICKSSDKGMNFTQVIDDTTFNVLGYATDGKDNKGQGFYDVSFVCSQMDTNALFVGGINVYHSNSGGKTWTCKAYWNNGAAPLPDVHADHHYMAYNPLNNKYYLCTDGGLYSTQDFNTYIPLNDSLCISQFYDIDAGQSNANYLVGGLQDNSTRIFKSGVWTHEIGGDGMVAEISDFDTSYVVGESQNGGLNLTKDCANSVWTDIANGSGSGINEKGPWVTHHEISPFNHNIHLVGTTSQLYYSRDLTTNSKYDSIAPYNQGSDFTTIRFSRLDSNRAYAGDQNGNLFVISNMAGTGSPTYVKKGGPDGTNEIKDIEIDYKNANTIYVICNQKVFKSINNGDSYSDITGNLPSVAYYTLATDKNSASGLYVGTETGVYYKDDSLVNWVSFATNLPVSSQIRDLEIWYDKNCSANSRIFAGTYGRGMWKSDLINLPYAPIPNFTNTSNEVKDTTVIMNNLSLKTEGGTIYKWTITPNTITYVNGTNENSKTPAIKFNAYGKYTITLYVENPGHGYCFIKKTDAISINTSAIPDSVKIAATTATTFTICDGMSATLGVKGAPNYQWSPISNLTLNNDSTATVSPSGNTVYKAVGIKGSARDSILFTVNVTPRPTVTVNPNNPTLEKGKSINLTASGADTYLWSPSNTLSFANTATVTANPTITTTYNVTGTKNACTDSVKVTVNVVNPTNLLALQKFNLSVYPNPTKNFLQVRSLTYPIAYHFISLDGKILSHGIIQSSGDKIDVQHYNPGQYVLYLNVANHSISYSIHVDK